MATRFEVSWKRSNGRYGRRRFSAASIEQAIERAPIAAGLEPDIPRMEGITLTKAFEEALGETRRRERSRGDWERAQLRFMRWLARKYPDCSHWHLLTRRIVRQYMTETFDTPDPETGKVASPNTKRLGMQPVTQAANYMEAEYQAPNVTRGLRINRAALVRETPMVYLEDAAAFLDWLRDNEPRLEAGAALQALAGLRVTEAIRLTWDKVDLERGLIEVSGETKTPWSRRVLPVAGRVLEALGRAEKARLGRKEILSLTDSVIVSSMGYSYCDGKDCYQNYGWEVIQAIRRWNPRISWRSKDLRNCLFTFFAIQGLAGDVTEQYLGHAPKSVTARHYIPRIASDSAGEAGVLERQMRIFRLHVVEPVNRAIREGGSAEILNIFERTAPSEAELTGQEAMEAE